MSITYTPRRKVYRSDLEYPTENVSFAYLAAIDKMKADVPAGGGRGDCTMWLTVDSFADKGVLATLRSVGGDMLIFLRWGDVDNWYEINHNKSRSTADHKIRKQVNGSFTDLATESVDLGGREVYWSQISGSSIKSDRKNDGTFELSATDTDLASGLFGLGAANSDSNDTATALTARLVAPKSRLKPAKVIIECEIEGSGTEEDPYRPKLVEERKEIFKLTGLPSHLYRDAKRYETLKAKGFTDEEVRLLLGSVPQHQVDLASVSWGVFEHKPKHSTMLVMVRGGNMYTGEKAILRQVEHAKSRGLNVLKPPRSFGEAVEQYRNLRRDYPDWLAGKEDYAYQTLGNPELELFANVDFYYGELLEHKTHYRQLKRVPDFEMRRRLTLLRDQLRKVKVLTDERNRHLKKILEVLKVGW